MIYEEKFFKNVKIMCSWQGVEEKEYWFMNMYQMGHLYIT